MIEDTCTAEWLGDQLCNWHDTVAGDGDVNVVKSGLLVLDCRSADDYAAGHVAGSMPVVVPPILLRRLRNGSASVAAVVSDASSRSLFTDHCRTCHVVLYDTAGDAVMTQAGASDSVIEVLINRLKQEGCRVSYLLST